jgi:hypothetical protein
MYLENKLPQLQPRSRLGLLSFNNVQMMPPRLSDRAKEVGGVFWSKGLGGRVEPKPKETLKSGMTLNPSMTLNPGKF